MPKAGDPYGTFGGVPEEQAQGGSAGALGVRATPNAFGVDTAQAVSNAGNQASALSQHLLQVATEAKVNDDYANKYAPAAAELRRRYDLLDGQDKVNGYDGYISSLHALNNHFTEQQPGFIGQKQMSALIDRHITAEIDGASRELATSQKLFSAQATNDMINANTRLAASNYNNPELVASVEDQNNNHIIKQFIDDGHNPNHPESAALIKTAQMDAQGGMARDMIERAINSGDAVAANELRSRYAPVIPGYMRLHLDGVLNVQNLQQTAETAVQNLKEGKAIPETVGAPPSKIQALVADTAKAQGVDPNHALTVLRIESANGQNLGERGTLGQDKESQGKSVDEQAKTLCENWNKASTQATHSLGRSAEPWEIYTVYQQGAGGGPALLQAAHNSPNARAVDVLAPLYKNRDDALDAVINNGGNVTMTSGAFLDHLKDVYESNAKRADCDFTASDQPGGAILKPHEDSPPAVQPAATPTQAYLNYLKYEPQRLDLINAIPNYETRNRVLAVHEAERKVYSEKASAYRTVLVNQAGQLMADPKFTSMDQVPPDMYAALATDSPQTIGVMEHRADYNADKASGNTTKDMREYGNGFYALFNAVHAAPDDPIHINSISELQKHVGPNGDITVSGYDRLVKEIQGKGTPEGEAEGMMKKQFFANAKSQISKSDPLIPGMKDPKGDEMYLRFMTQALPAIEKGKADGKSLTDLLNPDSKDYVGKSIPAFIRTRAQIQADRHAASEAAKTENDINTREGLRQAILAGTISREVGLEQARKLKFIRPEASTAITVPIAEE